MNSIAIAFLSISAIALLCLPRRWAPMPLLAGACYIPLSQGIEVGGFSFPLVRILIAVGFLRVLVRGERLANGMNRMDWLMLLWASWAIASANFHKDPSAALEFRLGLVYNSAGVYFLLRISCQSIRDVVALCCSTAVLLLPVAAEMLSEKMTSYNCFWALAGGATTPDVRDGRIRANGPFSHAILAGTVGAALLPAMIGLWSQHRKHALIGIGACVVMILACASSGPILSSFAGLVALFMWRYREYMGRVRRLVVIGYIGLELVMKAPAYYLMARVDLVGGSTGWHRAQLIDSALHHLNEWWFAGTDYTRHWMPTGVSWSPDHTDITNHYLQYGVIGGLLLMLLFIAIVTKGFSFVGHTLRGASELSPSLQFMVWSMGASLFTHAASMVSVSYFDQSFVFLFLGLGAIGSVWSATIAEKNRDSRI